MLTAVLLQMPDHTLLAPGRWLADVVVRPLIDKAIGARCSSGQPHILPCEAGDAVWTDDQLIRFIDAAAEYYLLVPARLAERFGTLADRLLVIESPLLPGPLRDDQVGIWADPSADGYTPSQPAIAGQVYWQRPTAAEWLGALVRAGDCDLHLHTDRSDGGDTPEQMVERVLAAGLAAFAICDHDSISALEPARLHLQSLCASQLITPPVFVRGVEISVDDQGEERHLLGYFPRGGTETIERFLAEQREQRRQRNEMLITRLQDLGYAVSREDFLATGSGAIGRLQVALLLRDRGYFPNVKEAFTQLLDYGRPAYIERQRPTAEQAIRLIRSAGGVPVLAHPANYGWCSDGSIVSGQLLARLAQLKACGLLGVEAYHGEATDENRKEISAAGQALGLVRTAGSDDHGRNKDHELLYRRGARFYEDNEILVSAALVSGQPQHGSPTWLLARRSTPGASQGFWEFPGGKVEPGESAAAALLREIDEELGVRARVGDLRMVLTHAYPERRVVLALFACWLPDSPMQLTAHDAYVFATAEEALALKLLPADIQVMQHLV